MRLISFNIWKGKRYDALIDYIKEYSESTDILCFQEMYKATQENMCFQYPQADLYGTISSLLPDFYAYFSGMMIEENFQYSEIQSDFGLACFVKKDIEVISFKDPFIVGERNKFFLYDNGKEAGPHCIQVLDLQKEGKLFSLLNYHGLWNGGGKFDSGDRILQSKKIRNIMDSLPYPKILCGDLNLRTDTESLAILKEGMQDLIEEYKIETTRSKLYGKPEKFADYTFVSPEIIVQNFQVPYSEASDHLPMILDFEI